MQSLFNNLCDIDDPNQIRKELSNLIDFSIKENKAFIKDFVDRVGAVKTYQAKAKRVAAQTNQKSKEMGGGTKS